MAKQLHHLFAQIYNRPQLVCPDYAQVLNGALQGRLGIDSLTSVDGVEHNATHLQQRALDYEGREARGYRETDEGIAIIDISGTLTSRGGIYPSSGITTYSGVRERLRLAAKDPDIRGILLDINSPGGMVANVDDTAQLIRSVSKEKPVWALAYDQMTSAAYYLASAANRIVATQSAHVGSIGVLVMHADHSKLLQEQGINITFIHAGARKVEGNPYEALPDDLRSKIQADVDGLYEQFTARVAEYRGIDQQKIKATEAGIFNAKEALELKLINEIMAADEVVERFARSLKSNTSTSFNAPGARAMSQKIEGAKTSDDVKPTESEQHKSADAAMVLELCEKDKMGFMASGLIKAGMTLESAQCQLVEAAKIRDVLAASDMEAHAEIIIKACGTLSEGLHKAIGMTITECKALQDEEQDNHLLGNGDTEATAINSASIYKNRNTG